MGMFDWYKPASELACPACGHALKTWQGKDGPCELFVWTEGKQAPDGQLVDEEYALSADERNHFRLPENFVIYSHDCPKHTVDAHGSCTDGRWVETTLLWPMPSEQVNAVELAYASGSLRLSAAQWCYVVLESDGCLQRLGAEVRRHIVDQLLTGLVGSLDGLPNGRLEGLDVHCVLSLFEDRASVWVAKQPDGRTLFFQNLAGGLVARLDLSEQVVETWVEALAAER